jgi:hypothetical protein
MKGILSALAAFLLLAAACGGDDDDASPSCATPGTSPPAGCWEQVLPKGSGAFPPGSGNTPEWAPGKFPQGLQPVIAFSGDLWMTSPRAAWSSPDGLTWTMHDKDETPCLLAAVYAFFDGRLWMYGGSELPGNVFHNEIWSSPDGEHWSKNGTAAWPGRDSTTVITFQGKLWLFGGATHRDQVTGATDAFLNDIWSSDDGMQWTQMTASAPWSPRDYPRVVVFKDELYLLGGQKHPDTWRSANGKDWTQLTAEAEWGQRHDYAAVVFDGRLWVFGGWKEKSTNALNDVWYSEDGANWVRQAEHAPWEERDPISIAYKDKLWIFSGKHTGARPGWVGDAWTMSASPE